MHHIFVNENIVDLANKSISLSIENDGETFNHLVKSLRIKEKEKVLCSIVPFTTSFDYLCEVSDVDDDKIMLTILEKTESRELPVSINLYQGISKADKLEFIVEKAVELGVNSITPLATEYCIAKIDDKKSDKKIDRFNKIAKSAAEQSKRHIIPEVKGPMKYDDLMKLLKDNANKGDASYNLLFYENASGISETKRIISEMKQKVLSGTSVKINVIIGPEGGFSEKEIEMARNSGLYILSLGDRILRTETAAVTALSILMYEIS